MRNIFVLILCMLTCVKGFSQDPHFSQFYASPLTLNPAFAGKFDGTLRVAGNYRDQWPTINRAYQTETVSADFPILKNKVASNDTWGVGLSGYSDKSANGAVTFNYLSAGTAFHKGLDEDGYTQLGFGFQATYANMNINTANLKFEDQLTPLGFTGVTSELFSGATLKSNYFDVNAGALFTTSTTDHNNFYAGISVYHINRPEQHFTGALYVLYPRATFHAGGYFPVGDITTLNVSALYSTQAGAHETVLGGALEFNVANKDADGEINFYVGSWLRVGDAIIPYIGLEDGSLRFGMTYDVNTSDLKTASNSEGGIELSIIYTFKQPGSKGLPCPKF